MNGLLDRRIFLRGGLAALGAVGGLAAGAPGTARAAGPLEPPPWIGHDRTVYVGDG